MGWKDLMKNVTDKATSVAETAQAKFEEQKQLSAIKKEEQNKKMEEMNERVTEYEQELLQNILSGFSGAPCIEVEDNILDFTKDYFEKLLLPANSVSASKITMYPYSDKIQKKAQKALREYDDTETPVFQFEGNKGEFILMTPTKLYIAVAFPENQTFVANVAVDLQQVSQLGFVSTEEGYQVVCNGVELFSADNVSEFDRITIEEYVRRLEEKDFEITETQIDEVIKKKIGDNILRIIRQYVFDDELLIYFAWGMDNITAKDFVVCTNKQILMLDREMLGATKNVKQFYYEDITSMSTDQKTSGWLEFALTAAFKLCNITIYVSGAQEKIQTLYTYEAERVIRVYQEYRRTDRDMTQTLYSLSSGTEKRRLSGGMEVNESSRFRTALFLTSEKSILSQCNMNTGLLTRNFEFQNVTWTSSAESADRIKSVVTENYGHIIPRVAKWLLAQDRQELVEKIVQETNAVIKRAREAKTYNNLTERTAKQSALILVAVDIVNEVLKLKLNKEAIGDFMEEHSLVNSVEQVSIGKRAMEWLLQFISKNYTQFLSKDSPKEISNCRGKLENMQTVLLNTDEESGMRLKVTDSEFMKILKEGHFSEKATVLKEWKEMGYLKAQSDRYISRIKIVGDIQVKGYIIQLPVQSNKIGGDGVKDYEEVLEERRKRINKPRQVIKDEYVEDDFFSIDDDDDLDFPEDWK